MVFESRPFRIMFVLRVIPILQNKRDDVRRQGGTERDAEGGMEGKGRYIFL